MRNVKLFMYLSGRCGIYAKVIKGGGLAAGEEVAFREVMNHAG